MSGEERLEVPQGPPWPPEFLADLHAGALDGTAAEDAEPRVRADPEAAAVLSALETTRAELGRTAAPEIPDDVVARIEASLAEEARALPGAARAEHERAGSDIRNSGEGGEVVDLDRVRARRPAARRRFLGAGAGLVAVAAALLGVLLVTGVLLPGGGNRPQAVRPPENPQPGRSQAGLPPLALQGGAGELGGERLASVLGAQQYLGTLSDPARLLACLQANGVRSGKPLGAREVRIEGRPAQLMLLPTGEIGRFRLLAVRPQCGPGNPATISDTVVGGGN